MITHQLSKNQSTSRSRRSGLTVALLRPQPVTFELNDTTEVKRL